MNRAVPSLTSPAMNAINNVHGRMPYLFKSVRISLLLPLVRAVVAVAVACSCCWFSMICIYCCELFFFFVFSLAISWTGIRAIAVFWYTFFSLQVTLCQRINVRISPERVFVWAAAMDLQISSLEPDTEKLHFRTNGMHKQHSHLAIWEGRDHRTDRAQCN